MPLTLLLLASAAFAAGPVEIPLKLAAPQAAVAVGGILAALPPHVVLADPKLSALALRLPELAAAAVPTAHVPQASAAHPRSSAQASQAVAALHAGLAGLSADDIKKLPAESLGAAAAAMWEGVAAAANANRSSHESATDYEKRYRTLEYYLQRKGYGTALKALDFAKRFHTGTRKDGSTPELQHQLEIALYLSTLKDLRDEESTLAVGLLHDVMEDYDIEPRELEALFGPVIAAATWKLTKVHKGVKKKEDVYFAEIAADPIASLVKGADRIQNVQSMVGVFTRKKQDEYIQEVETWFLPMLKQARDAFSDQADAYRNIRLLLKSQLDLIRKTRKGG